MKIALIGATGFVGAALLEELLQRGHDVTALARTPAKLAPRAGHDAVVSAYNPGWNEPELYAEFLRGHNAIVEGTKRAGIARFIVVGGAGSLFVAPGVQLVDTPAFNDHVPPNIVPGARAARDALTELRGENALDWTFVSPPVGLAPGERSGVYRLGGEEVLMAGDTPAGISVADLAVAIVDELERPRHSRQRFTAAAA
jgi:putative NADH-flavin reductase